MKNIANCISVSRILISIVLLATDAFSVSFCILYFYCGLSDMLDGFVARMSKNESKIGAWLDSAADIAFAITVMIKLLPVLNLTDEIIIWMALIVLIKVVNVICGYIRHKRIVLPHTILDKITGLILFIAPFIIVNTGSILFEIIICIIATFAAVQEWYSIREGN